MKILRIIPAILISSLLLTSCEDLLEVDSNRFVTADDYKLDSPDERIYAMSGIFEQLQKIGERYVILGELRGDLMDITENADYYLQQINNFNVTPDNPYVNIRDYYTLINNCNYFIERIDTSVVYYGAKIFYREYAAIKAIRAWVYMQVALNYGKAVYFEKPLLNIDDASKTYPELGIAELANVLIPDLQPWKEVVKPQYGSDITDPESFLIGDLNSKYFYIPIRFLLGELYLWSGQYENAANEYHDLIYKERVTTGYEDQSGSEYLRSTWSVVNGEFVQIYSRWPNIFASQTWEILSEIGTTSEYGKGTHLLQYSWPLDDNGNLQDETAVKIRPSKASLSYWDSQVYYDANAQNTTYGDLRGYLGSYTNMSSNSAETGRSTEGVENYIAKYYWRNGNDENNELITTCRGTLVYLRYAEAVNRLGKPNLAFAVLKHGLMKSTFADTSKIPANEVPSSKPNYMNFDTTWFTVNIGVHGRGCGYMENAKDYKIPSLPSLADSVNYVEDMIKLELALETAFEGNRFHDLMRIALRRNDPSSLANTVAEKYTTNKEAIRAKLTDANNWYLPKN
jgi:hypothetical protein